MKRFVKTVTGKTCLFISCIVAIVLLIAAAIGSYVMIEADFYTRDKEEIYYENIRSHMHYDLYNTLWKYLLDEDELNKKESPLEYQLLDQKGNLLYQSANYEEDHQCEEFVFNVVKDEKGNITDIYEAYSQEENDAWIVKGYLSDQQNKVSYYSFMRKGLDLLYPLRYSIYLIAIILLLLLVFSFVTLMNVAGRRNEDEQLHPGPLNVIPFDVLLAAGIFLFVGCIYFADYFLHGDDVLGILTILLLGLLCIVLFLGLCVSAASRIKQRNLVKGSLTYLLIKYLLKCIRFIFKKLSALFRSILSFLREIPLVWKTALLLLLLTGTELLFLMISYSDFYVAFWFVKNLILIPSFIYIAICMKKLQKAGMALADGDLSYHLNTDHMFYDLKKHGDNLNNIAKGMSIAVEKQLKSERMKTELITNVSHDIKTPLTSIINYSDLISKEKSSRKIKDYAEVLLRQSERLKRLLEDLVEVSKASTGNLEVNLEPCDASIFIGQAAGEYEDKLKDASLELIVSQPEEEVMIMADGRRMWRIFDNLMNNICKYAQENTRVYLSLEKKEKEAVITFRNTSRDQLNISEDELLERFTRGDKSRNTEGNGLGLSIARSLAELQSGSLKLSIDGDLFKAILRFPLI